LNTLDYLTNKYKLDLSISSPIKIPNVGRNCLSKWCHELGFKVGVEVGVAEGEYSEIISKANPQLKMYGIDPYKPYEGSTDYILEDEFDKRYQQARKRLKHFRNYTLIKEFSIEALKKFKDESLDFVYIDANHSEPYVTQDIKGWSKKVKRGGIIAGHDYVEAGGLRVKTGTGTLCGQHYKYRLYDEPYRKWNVKEAVHAYTREKNIKPWFLLDFEFTTGIVDDSHPSWMWIKQ